MALVFFTGFDTYASAQLTSGIFTATNSAAVSAAQVFTGAGSLLVATSTSYAKVLNLPDEATWVLGFARYYSSSPGEERVFCALSDGDGVSDPTKQQVNIRMRTNGKLAAYRAGTQVGSDSTNALLPNIWYEFQVVATIGNSGSVEVYVNGSKTNWIDLSGVDIQATGNASANSFHLACSANANNQYFDNVYAITATGGTMTSRPLTGAKVISVLPSTGNGTYADSTPSSGTDRGAMVDESTPDSDTTYNAFSAVGKDSYAFADQSFGTVYGTQVRSWLKKTDSGTCDARNVAVVGGTAYYGSVENVGTGYIYYNTIWELNPATGLAWTDAEINASQFGVERNQ